MTRFRVLAGLGCAVLSLAFSSVLRADSYSYVMGGGGVFVEVDLNTGATYPTGGGGINSVCTNTIYPASPYNAGPCVDGLGVLSGSIYAVSDVTGESNFYSITPGTATSSTPVGSIPGPPYVVTIGSTPTGLYAIESNGSLYSLTSSGETLIGATGLTGITEYGMSNNCGSLWFDAAGNLYTLNTSTGGATLVGAMGALVGPMVCENGTLWASNAYNPSLPFGTQPAGEIFTINTSSGAATDTGVNTGRGPSGGLVPAPAPTPEPGTFSLLLSGIFCLAALVAMGYPRNSRSSEM